MISLFNVSCLFAITSLIGCEIKKAEMSHWLFVNMPFTKEDKILITNLFELKGYNVRHLVREFCRKKTKMSAASTSCCNRNGSLVGRMSSWLWQVTQCPH